MRVRPQPPDEFDAWLAEVCRQYRKIRRNHRRALMDRIWNRQPDPTEEAASRELDHLICWPRRDDGELKLNTAARARKRS